ncbi:MAG: low temperature requirement protein A [Actinomycetota bacterium]|nr:low temperature requirement protein A [Actinomycetota bacterium]
MASVLDSVRAHLRGTDDEHRVTTLELFFDLVFVYALTNVTGLMEHDVGGETVLEGVITLALVWFGWCAYTWLGNQAKADEGLLRVAMVVAMAGMFFVAISIPHAFEPEANAAMVLASAYAVVRLTHLGVYLIAAGDDTQLRSVILSMAAVASVMLVLLFIGAAVGGSPQKWWWLAAVVVDQLGVYFVRSTRWRLNSASHFAERFGLIMIIAIGESIVAVGAATSEAQLSGRDALALLCGLAIAVCLWWLYFDVVALVAEEVLRRTAGVERARLARDSYVYVHLLFVGGIVFAALGMVLLIGDHGHIDAGRYALYGGIVCYFVGHLLFRLRNVGSVNVGRAVVATMLLAGIPTLGGVSALVQVLVPAVFLVALVAYEVRAFREPRNEIRTRRRSSAAMGE